MLNLKAGSTSFASENTVQFSIDDKVKGENYYLKIIENRRKLTALTVEVSKTMLVKEGRFPVRHLQDTISQRSDPSLLPKQNIKDHQGHVQLTDQR